MKMNIKIGQKQRENDVDRIICKMAQVRDVFALTTRKWQEASEKRETERKRKWNEKKVV